MRTCLKGTGFAIDISLRGMMSACKHESHKSNILKPIPIYVVGASDSDVSIVCVTRTEEGNGKRMGEKRGAGRWGLGEWARRGRLGEGGWVAEDA